MSALVAPQSPDQYARGRSELVAWARSCRQSAPCLFAGAKLMSLGEDSDPFRSPPVEALMQPFVRAR